MHRPSGAIIRDWHIRDDGLWGKDQVYAADKREVAIAIPQGPAGKMKSHQRGGAGRINRDGGAMKTQGVSDPAGGDARGRAGAVVSIATGGIARLYLEMRVVVGGHSNVNAGEGAAQAGRCDARMFERLPGGFEKEALLRIELRRLAWGDAEECGIKPVHGIEEAAARGVHLAGHAGPGIKAFGRVPAAAGHLAGGVASCRQELPERLRGVGVAGETASHPH